MSRLTGALPGALLIGYGWDQQSEYLIFHQALQSDIKLS